MLVLATACFAIARVPSLHHACPNDLVTKGASEENHGSEPVHEQSATPSPPPNAMKRNLS
eukprot:2012047-Amphidinium_carterae.1